MKNTALLGQRHQSVSFERVDNAFNAYIRAAAGFQLFLEDLNGNTYSQRAVSTSGTFKCLRPNRDLCIPQTHVTFADRLHRENIVYAFRIKPPPICAFRLLLVIHDISAV